MVITRLLDPAGLWDRASSVLKNRKKPSPASRDDSADGSNAEPIQPETPPEPALAPLMQRLRQAAWNNHIADGELQQGYLAMRLEEAGKRAAHATRRAALSVERDALEAELMAIIHQPAPSQPLPPEPKVLRPMPTVVPFAQGGKRHD